MDLPQRSIHRYVNYRGVGMSGLVPEWILYLLRKIPGRLRKPSTVQIRM